MSVMAPLSCMMEVFAFENRSAFLCTMQASDIHPRCPYTAPWQKTVDLRSVF